MSNSAEAILNVLRDIKVTPEKAIGMFEIGIPLVIDQRFTVDEVLNGLFWLQSEKVVELLGNNTLRLLKPFG
jgi:hypothetical protein